MARRPLQGVRVLDHGIVYAGPACGAALADLGAEVIRIEPFLRVLTGTRSVVPASITPSPMILSQFPDHDPGADPWNRGGTFNGINRNKVSVALDLEQPDGRDLYDRLLRLSDVVVENFAGGVMDRLGLGYQNLKQINPNIIMISMSGFGGTGPYGRFVSFGSNVDAIAGHTLLRGYPGEEPNENSTMVWPDNVGGATGAFAVLSALIYRARTGKGQYIDLSQVESFAGHMGDAFMEWSLAGRLPQQLGNRHPFWAPHGAYPSSGQDAWLTIAVEDDAQFASVCKAMSRPDLASDRRFATAPARKGHEDELDQIIGAWTCQRPNSELAAQLQAAGVPAFPVMGPKQLYGDAHLAERAFFPRLTHPSAGTHDYPGVPWRFSRTPVGVRSAGPQLGEHNHAVLEGLLGLTSEGVDDLERRRLISNTYPPDVIMA